MDREKGLSSPLVERHYVLPNSTENLDGVTTDISEEIYLHVVRTLVSIGTATERGLGEVRDETAHYTFIGDHNLFLPYGVVQSGIAKTSDHLHGFVMVRLFSNSLEDMAALEEQIGIRTPPRAA
jgi:hypothetical protein